MNVQCSAERLSAASRFDTYQERPLFPRFQRRLSEVLDPRPASTEAHAGRLAVDATYSESEELPGSYIPIDESSMMGLVDGPGGTVTAYSFDFLSPSDSLL